MRQRAGNAHDPDVAEVLVRNTAEVLVAPEAGSSWDDVLDFEPRPHLTLDEDQLDRALAAMGDFADLVSPSLSGHSSGVALLAEQAARHLGMGYPDVMAVRRAGFVQDIGRVAIRPRVWARDGALSPDEREQVRLHSYHTERILSRSPQLRELATLAGCHHERLDGSGYHKGLTAAMLPVPARLLAAADVFRALTQPPTTPTSADGTHCGACADRRGQGPAARRGCGRRRPDGSGGVRLRADPPAGWPHPPRDAGGRSRGARPGDQAGRPCTQHQSQDG
jgi:HD domain